MVAIYDNQEEVRQGIIRLQTSGYNMKKLSIVGKDYHLDESTADYYNLGDPMKKWDNIGAYWGGLWGLLFGSACFSVPGVGSLFIAGPFVAPLMGALEGSVTIKDLSALGVALVSIGVPQNNVLEYETKIKAGKCLLLAHGTEAEIKKARAILNAEVHVQRAA
jgi:hypothetical protein